MFNLPKDTYLCNSSLFGDVDCDLKPLTKKLQKHGKGYKSMLASRSFYLYTFWEKS